MKKLVIFTAFLLCMALTANGAFSAGAAYAPIPLQRQETVMLEGNEEPFTATLYRQADLLFSLWYDAAHFAPVGISRGVRFELIGNNLEAPVFFQVENVDYLQEDHFSQLIDEYERQGWACEPFEAQGMLSGFHFEEDPVQGLRAQKGDDIAYIYLCFVTSGAYAAILRYPLEAAEGWGARMAHMLNTLRPMPGE